MDVADCHKLDPQLERVIEFWSELSEAMRASILAMIGAFLSRSDAATRPCR